MEKVKCLLVDDSMMFLKLMESGLSKYPKIDVVGIAEDAFEAKDKIRELNPDVLVIDIEMPKMNGKEFLRQVMAQSPKPCIMITAGDVTEKEVLTAGAAGFVNKPRNPAEAAAFCNILSAKIVLAPSIKHRAIKQTSSQVDGFLQSVAVDDKGKYRRVNPNMPSREDISGVAARGRDGYIVLIGASTGGTDALECVVQAFPADMPPVVIVQHMPPVFTKMFADRLNRTCKVTVAEANDGDRLSNGLCLIGAGGLQLEVKRDTRGYFVKCYQGEKVSGHCPSVDVMFSSAAEAAGKKAVGVILTGMGADGAKGLLKMRKNGAYTIGQDKDSCIVYGMPMEAYKMGACSEQQPLDNIGLTVCKRLTEGWR